MKTISTLFVSGITLAVFFTPSGFCKGVRFDNQNYNQFISQNALPLFMSTNVTSEERERMRAERAKVWGGQVKVGQMQLCGATTITL